MEHSGEKTILLVEDDAFLASLIKNRLEREHFRIQSIANGTEVLPFLRATPPDLVLLDIILPGKLGFEILQEAKQDPALKTIPFMIISNLAQETDITKAHNLGAVEYFVKAQIKIDDLIAKISRFLGVGAATA